MAVFPSHSSSTKSLSIIKGNLPDATTNRLCCCCCCNRLLNQAQQLQFTCRVIHSIPLLMSAVQVFHTDQMVAVSHLIGTDQLPTSKMVISTVGADFGFEVQGQNSNGL